MVIVGMGGLGKTTVAQIAYNDDMTRKHFDEKLWIHASDNCDSTGLTRAMIESVTGKPCHLTRLDTLHTSLNEELHGKRLLLVLDDVWEEKNLSSNWDTFTAPLRNGSKGSKIIITTRNEKVSKITRATSTYHLPCLQEDDCFELFKRHAFEGRDVDSLPSLEAIGEKISMKCRGLPLAAKTLGSLLCGQNDEQVWNSILDYDIRDINEENTILSILGLSYQHLPAHLKRCFRYCSLFPKGYQFDRDQLVRTWMAHGYIEVEVCRRSTEDVGVEYFNDLLRRSFFQNSQDPKIFLMHDLLHDLARSVSREECCSVEADKSCSIPTDVRHISIVRCKGPESLTLSRHNDKPSTIRSLVFTSCEFGRIFPVKPLDGLHTRMERLRVLHLGIIDLKEWPSSIVCLKHLRYLGLRTKYIKRLPESIGSLCHLQTLDVEFSGIKILPHSISNLLNLRHIICEHSIEYPVGIGKLINLQTMPDFHVNSRLGFAKLGELKDINTIRSLSISGIDNLTDVEEAKKACLGKKKELRALSLRWKPHYCPSSIDNEVLESLKPHPRLECLEIHYFMGGSLPSWLVQRGECCSLRKLSIFHCRGLAFLSLMNLVALEELKITGHNELRFSLDSSVQMGKLPCLRKVLITWGNMRIEGLFSRGGIQSPKTSWLRLQGVGQLSAQFALQQFGVFHPRLLAVSSLSLEESGLFGKSECEPHLTSLTLDNLIYLQHLEIHDNGPVRSVTLGNQIYLQYMEIYGCSLQSLPLGDLNSLERLNIIGCARLQFPYEEQLPSTLRALYIKECPPLTKWCQHHRQRLAHIRWLDIEGLVDEHVVLQNVFSVQEAADAYLGGLRRLHSLELVWDCHAGHGSFGDEKPEEVLMKLLPHNNLSKLVIQGYTGSRFATWLGDPSFTKLVYVTLIHCPQCIVLPPLGQLPFLAELYIGGAHMLRHVGQEFLSDTCSSQAFPSLTKLEFNDMPSWDEWVDMQDGYLLHLCQLILKHCPVLKALPRLPTSLREMEVANCDMMTFPHSLDHITSLRSLRISRVPVLKNLPDLPSGLRKLVLERLPALVELMSPPSLRELVLQHCSEAMVVTSLPSLTLLTSLHISDFPELTNIPLHNLRILQELRISNCLELETLDCIYFSSTLMEYIEGLQSLRSLERLSISGCPKLHFFANERPPSALQSMDITDCPLLQPWHDKHWRNCIKANN